MADAMTFSFPAHIRATEGTYIVTFPDVPEALTEGSSQAEAMLSAADALETALLGRMKDGADLPTASARAGDMIPVAPSAHIAAKLALYQAWRESGVSKSELARRIGCHETEVRRMLDPHHRTKIAGIEKALAALDRRLVISVAAA